MVKRKSRPPRAAVSTAPSPPPVYAPGILGEWLDYIVPDAFGSSWIPVWLPDAFAVGAAIKKLAGY